MSVLVLQTPFQMTKYEWPVAEERYESKDDAVMAVEDDEERPGQLDIWSAIQAQKAATVPPAPYVHPLVRRSSSSLSQKSLQTCTESLGSETGSDDFSSFLDELDVDYLPMVVTEREEENHDVHDKLVTIEERRVWRNREAEEREVPQRKGKELTSVNYHCSVGRRSTPRLFPPPLPSICRHDGGPCLHMRPRRREGRLLVEAVSVPSKNYLHAQREGGRLLLSFIDATFHDASSDNTEMGQPQEQNRTVDEELNETKENEVVEIARLEEEDEGEENCYEEGEDEEEEEEEVEVVDRGTVVEVKVSTQPQQPSGGAMKVLRSSLVINKFVGCNRPSSNARVDLPPESETSKTRLNNQDQAPTAASVMRRPPPTTATAAAAVVAASVLSGAQDKHSFDRAPDSHLPPDNKLLFTSRRWNWEELLHSMRGCSQLRGPLFIWDPCCIVTSSS
ncbi:hypothetical protein C4D60_Mb04t31520 [Musa balbisiana]|uniref:FAF domain-containing protein n=1 Tax=Musa balbisiana TaxID=52838 RepID=A0A4S8KG10_MUSBA|nr:hypothetical protein C4D60_Mb04t31520 [Musa balbisiana]